MARSVRLTRILAAAAIALASATAAADTRQPCGLTDRQRLSIERDLAGIAEAGFATIRFITFTEAGDPAYRGWPRTNFLSWPVPTAHEIANLTEFLGLVHATGMRPEIVLLMPDAAGSYYRHGVDSGDYKRFIDAIWPAVLRADPVRLYIGGDLVLGDGTSPDPARIAAHRRWIGDIWPYVTAKCPTCRSGVELLTGNAGLSDAGAASAAWVRQNLSPLPSYLGFQYYPTGHAALRALGFERGGIVAWSDMAQHWIDGVRNAAGRIPVAADEIGLSVGGDFGEADQSRFLAETIAVLGRDRVDFNIWEFADHPALGRFGLLTETRRPRPALSAIAAALGAAKRAGVAVGVQYIPPEADDLGWLMPPPGSPGCAREPR